MKHELTYPEQREVCQSARAACDAAQEKIDKLKRELKQAELEYAVALERLSSAQHELLKTL